MCVIILALFHKTLIVQAIKDIKTEHNQIKELKENIYRTEKWAINSNSEYVYMPLSYKRLCIIYDTCYIEYFNNANSKLSNKKDVIFTDDYDYENIFAEEEIEKLHFTNLL